MACSYSLSAIDREGGRLVEPFWSWCYTGLREYACFADATKWQCFSYRASRHFIQIKIFKLGIAPDGLLTSNGTVSHLRPKNIFSDRAKTSDKEHR